MSTRKKPTNFVQRLLKRVWRSFNVLFKALLNGVLRGLRVNKRRSRQTQAGFVLPTVVMVVLVVALLTTAIVIRSFDRAKNASNFRVDQAVLNAATPAIDRAKAKIERLLSPDENRLEGSPPREGQSIANGGSISFVLSQPQYTFGDETQLKLVYNNPNAAPPNDPAKQTLETVWKFPVDTDNNGKYDTFTLYGIYFRNPPVEPNGNPTRKRTPVEARSLPQATGTGGTCAASSGGSASGADGWYPTDGQLKKAFFVYVANVPISQADITQLPTTAQSSKYEPYKGNKGFSALEMQEDQARISLDNNAVWYDDDLVIFNVPTFRVNGRIHTNSNLMVGTGGEPIIFYQVSATESCYYTRENSLITVGGNVLIGNIASTTNTPTVTNRVEVHRYPSTANEYIDASGGSNATTTTVPREGASNSGAYDKRLNGLVQCTLSSYGTQDATTSNVNNFAGFPPEVKSDFSSRYDSTNPTSGSSILTQVLTTYFAKRIRRVSYKEVPFGTNPYVPYADLTAACAAMGSPINPPVAWMSQIPPLAPDQNVPPVLSKLPTTTPPISPTGTENLIGDRISVGNALPTAWLKSAPPTATYAKKGDEQDITGATGQGPTKRKSQAQQLDDLGDTSRGGFWEEAAAYSGNAAKNYPELAGGLRIVTGAGIYIDGEAMSLGVGTGKRGVNSFLPAPPTVAQLKQIAASDANGVKLPQEIQSATDPTNLVVWPDTMPMFRWDDTNGDGQYTWGAGEVKRGDLQMRASVVYHHAIDKGTDQEPIACVATLYDPTNADTAQNATIFGAGKKLLPPNSPDYGLKDTEYGTSINGITFDASRLKNLRAGANNDVLKRQANMIFPNGRWVNEPLRKALEHLRTGGESSLTLNDIAAIDAANCALLILYDPTPVNNPLVPLGAIQERTFLDARQIKAIHKRNTDTAGQPLTRIVGGAAVPIDRQTLLQDITDPAKLKIAELGSLAPIDPATKKESSLPPEYSLPIEQRQPLEIRVTQIDLAQLRKTVVKANTGGAGIADNTEYMLPNTGIIYATRDDALPDVSDDPEKGSATDFKLDPTRRPNGIRLINGQTLARQDSNTNRLAEKGLILASDLPVYIKGSFNLHAAPNPSATPTFKEEFTDLLPDGFTKTQFYGRTDLDKSFACRKGASGCTGDGDQWRPARILADAVTLLSGTFRDGYRNDGDFDLNNNIGNLAVEERLKSGFWWNNFVTTNPWYGANGFPTDLDPATGTQDRSSYLTNGVTPIQRRVNFPEYKMEICRKFPVSECTPTDWVLEGAGTTATAPSPPGTTPPTTPIEKARFVDGGDTLFPRRVAFQRQGGLLQPDANGQPIPLGVDPDATNLTGIKPYPYGSAPPPAQNNALWFATTATNVITNSNTDPSNGLSYNNTDQLFYRKVYEAEGVSEKQLLLPGLDKAFESIATGLNGLPGAGTATEASDYAVYTVDFRDPTGATCVLSQAYAALNLATTANNPTTGLTGAPCTTPTTTAIGQLWTGLRAPTASAPGVSVNTPPLTLSDVRATSKAPTAQLKLTLKAQAKVNVYDLPLNPDTKNSELSNVEITLDRNYQQDAPIFVFRAPIYQCTTPNDFSKCNIDFQYAVKMRLKGVDPNNVFWATELDHIVRIYANAPPSPNISVGTEHELTGNFIGGGTKGILVFDEAVPPEGTNLPLPVAKVIYPATLAKPVIYGGRILGFNGTYPNYPFPPNAMTAMTVVDQPALIPILQLHSAQGNPTDGFGTATINQDYWVQRVPKTTPKQDRMYNAVLIMGDSPSRPPGESGGGLPNFPRFLEAWENAGPDATSDEAVNDIKGSFIQFKKSAFATAPFEAVDDPTQDNSLFFDGASPVYMTGFTEAGGRPYIYKGGAAGRLAPYYRPPQRQWGYDVGLLTQTPDLFSRRFANPTVGTPNQYFRQVNRNDPWIETLLCAAQPTTGGTGAQWAIADPQQRPSNCPPIADYSNANNANN
jgi:type II secretory pathway pseudopilin PulG